MQNTPLCFSPDDDIVDICRDTVFKAIFTRNTPSSRGALRRLLSALVGRDVEVLTVIANEPPIIGPGDRQIRYDIRATFDQGRLANIEMTLNPRDFETLRMEYYAARLYSTQSIRGKKRSFGDLTDTYQISLVRGRRLFDDEALVHRFHYYDEDHGVSLGGRIHIVVVELDKVERLLEKPAGGMGAAEWWALFFRYVADPRKRVLINELLKYEEGIAMAGQELLRVSLSERWRAWRESEFKYKLDRQSDMVEAHRAGERIGLEKGKLILETERREIARKMKKRGIAVEQIAEDTGLSLKEVEGLQR
jgi:predicted transposase/invertase (TIGR01784 family)